MDAQRKKVLLETRAKEQEKFRQMEERRKALELADFERREALKKKNQEREERMESRRKSPGVGRLRETRSPQEKEPGAGGAHGEQAEKLWNLLRIWQLDAAHDRAPGRFFDRHR